jgi:hypothetical protein
MKGAGVDFAVQILVFGPKAVRGTVLIEDRLQRGGPGGKELSMKGCRKSKGNACASEAGAAGTRELAGSPDAWWGGTPAHRANRRLSLRW